jgi:hypothetical protein
MRTYGKEIPGFPDYKITRSGDVYSMARTIYRSNGRHYNIDTRKLKPGTSPGGYLHVSLGQGNTRTVHSLVAITYLGARPSGYDVRHLNGNKLDNSLDNLSYGTRLENIHDSIRLGVWAHGDTFGHSKLTSKDVLEIRSTKNDGWGFYSRMAEVYNVHNNTIRDAYQGRTWKCL